MKNIVIEFLGIPGSGKTYMCNMFKTILQKNNIKVYDQSDLYQRKNLHGAKKVLKGIKILLTPAYFIMYLDILFLPFKLSKKIKKSKYLTKILLQQEYLIRILRKNQSTVYLIDEGFVDLQRPFIENSSERRKKRVESFLNFLLCRYKNADVIVICIDGNAEISYQRIENREQGWPNYFSNEPDIETKMQHLRKLLNEYEDVFSLLPNNVEIHSIDTRFDKHDIELWFQSIMKHINNSIEERI